MDEGSNEKEREKKSRGFNSRFESNFHRARSYEPIASPQRLEFISATYAFATTPRAACVSRCVFNMRGCSWLLTRDSSRVLTNSSKKTRKTA